MYDHHVTYTLTRHQWMHVPYWGFNQRGCKSDLGFSTALPKVNQSWWGPLGLGSPNSSPPNLKSIGSTFCLQMHRNHRPGHGMEQKINHVWGVPWVHPQNLSSIQSMVCLRLYRNCLKNPDARKWWNLTAAWPKANQAWRIHSLVHPSNLSSICKAVCLQMHRLLDQWKDRKCKEFSGAWPKVNQAWGVQ